MSPTDEPYVIVVRIAGDRAIVIGPSAETRRSGWGHRIADLAPGEWSSLLQALEPATRAFVESQRWAGGLVELDAVSQAMWSTARKLTEEGDWVQAVLRDDRGKFAHLMRVRPGTGVAVIAGGVAVLGAISAQVQTAQMARDISAIRQRVADVYQYLQSDQIGAVENAVEQVEDLVSRLREHGTEGIEAGEIPIIRNSLGAARRKCMHHLKDAVTRLEEARGESPRQAVKILSDDAIEEVMLNLDLLGQIHLATVQLELAQIAVCFHDGKLGLVKTRTAGVTQSAARFRAEIEDVCGRLDELDANIRTVFRPVWQYAIQPTQVLTAAGAAVAYTAARKLAADKTIRIPGVRFPIPLAAAVVGGGAMLTLGEGVANGVLQPRAEKKVDDRLGRLTESRTRSAQTLNQATPSLEMLQSLMAELAVPAD